MSVLFARIRADAQAASRQKTAVAGLLKTLFGEAETLSKTPTATRKYVEGQPLAPITDDEVTALVQKFMKLNGQAQADAQRLPAERRVGVLAQLVAEARALAAYLPAQLSEADIEAFVRARAEEGLDMGGIMKALKTAHAGSYDGKTASSICKAVLAAAE